LRFFFTTVAGASTALLGLIEGFADFAASSLNYLAGWLSDRSGKRKVFSLAYFSFGFLLLRAHSVGFAVKDIVLLYALFNIAFVVAAPLVGKLGDRWGRPRIIVLGYLVYLLMSLGFAFASTKWQVIVLFVIFGVFYSIDEAQSKAFIADIELERRASAIGLYNFVTGIIYVPASLLAGVLWVVHPVSVFLVAAGLAFAAITAFIMLRPARHRSPDTTID
jgi:MFS family permease